VTIKIPKPLYDNLREIIEDTGFNSVTELVVFILRDIASARPGRGDEPLNREEIDLIRKRLRSLGYL
jgi:hypothetical protein